MVSSIKANCSRQHSHFVIFFFFFFFRENKTCQADDSHELLNLIFFEKIYILKKKNKKEFKEFVCLFVLRFYGPVNPMGSCRARSVYLTTRLLGRLSPLSG